MKPHLVLFAITMSFSISESVASSYLCKVIDRQWHWFSDHGAVWIEYVSVGQPGRTYEVGTGISVRGSPWGSRSRYSGNATFKAYGVGALHIRQADDGEPFKVCASAEKLKPIDIIKSEF